jgi:hypothetical protein
MKTKHLQSAAIFTSLILMSGMVWAQSSSGTLAVHAELASSINLTFVTDPSGVALTGSGTNAAALDFGTVSLYSTPAANVTQTVGTGNFMVSTPFDVSVTKSNVTSANYALSAVLTTVDGTNSWAIDTFPLPTSPTAPASLTVTGVYASNVPHTLHLTIPNSEGAATISNTIDFLATAN